MVTQIIFFLPPKYLQASKTTQNTWYHDQEYLSGKVSRTELHILLTVSFKKQLNPIYKIYHVITSPNLNAENNLCFPSDTYHVFRQMIP